ncbi:hypothetical protein FIBSPDRAFT_886905 [Athelia psychrophila]|uniref:Uncharacterized protein n=1 Tax=Athelia psychrophila TaxID=1759441 RepID=A0A166QD35_9AGAM|nr:hypothetical protein FIBSPDRAFT_886905 [Fibularhizoctonia sp. CBS 109695]
MLRSGAALQLSASRTGQSGLQDCVKVVKASDHIQPNNVSQPDFIHAFLNIHDLADFKIHWTAAARVVLPPSTMTIKSLLPTLTWKMELHLALSGRQKYCTPLDWCLTPWEFNTSARYGVHSSSEKLVFHKLENGTSTVPQVGLFSEDAQLHEAIVLQPKQKFPYTQHQGENGDISLCFIGPNGEHTGLNLCRLKIWAAAIPSTIATPPHISSHISITFSMPMLPLPGHRLELCACHSDFAEALRINITDGEAPLMELKLTPDIIPNVPAAWLCDINGVIKGRILKFQVYSTWNI